MNSDNVHLYRLNFMEGIPPRAPLGPKSKEEMTSEEGLRAVKSPIPLRIGETISAARAQWEIVDILYEFGGEVDNHPYPEYADAEVQELEDYGPILKLKFVSVNTMTVEDSDNND